MENVKNNEVKKLDLAPPTDIQVVNPNTSYIYRDTIGGRNYTFEPLQIYSIAEEQAEFLVSRAERSFGSQSSAARGELESWLRLKDDPSHYRRSLAVKFCDPDGTPRSQPPPRPGLVRLDNQHGNRLYKEGLKEYKSRNKKVDQPVKDIDLEEKPKEEVPALANFLVEPDLAWGTEKKIRYIKEFHYKKPAPQCRTNSDILDKQLQDAFVHRREQFDKLGVNYQIVDGSHYEPKG